MTTDGMCIARLAKFACTEARQSKQWSSNARNEMMLYNLQYKQWRKCSGKKKKHKPCNNELREKVTSVPRSRMLTSTESMTMSPPSERSVGLKSPSSAYATAQAVAHKTTEKSFIILMMIKRTNIKRKYRNHY